MHRLSPPRVDRRLPVAIVGTAVLAVLAISAVHAPTAQAADANTPVLLGTTEQFAVIAGSGITNTGPTTIQGDIGSFPTASETISDVTLDGTDQGGNGVTQQAKQDLETAYVDAEDSSRAVEDPTELGGRTLVAGVYGNNTELGLTGTVTLIGDSDDVFVFQAGSTLVTGSGSSVVLAGEVQACNVFWQVGSSATFGTGTSFVGTVMALTSISAQQGATFEGRLLARNGAVTLIENTITAPGCAADTGDDGDGTGGGDDTDGTDEGDDTGGTDGTGGADGSGDADGGDSTGGTGADDTPAGAGADGVTDGTDGVTDGGADGSSDVADGPGSPSSNDALPDTGGSSLWLLVAGIGTLMAGAGILWGRRGRGTHMS